MSVLSSEPQVQFRTVFSFPLPIADACSTVRLLERLASGLTFIRIHGESGLIIGTLFACKSGRQTYTCKDKLKDRR
jgi:hypothetical protein